MPKVSQDHIDARRRQILDGAREAFAKHGYDGATVVRLEEETGLSRGAIFNYFESKQDIFVELSIDVNRRFVDLVVEGGLDEAVRALANESPEWLAVLLEVQVRLQHDAGFVEQLGARSDDGDRFIAWFRERQADGTFRDDIDLVNLRYFATMVINGLALRLASGDQVDVDAILTLLRDALGPRNADAL